MAGLTLNARDVAELRDLVRLVDDGGPVLAWSFLNQLQELVGCDAMVFNGQDSRRRLLYFGQTADDGAGHAVYYGSEACAAEAGDPDEDPFWTHYWDSPPCSHQEAVRDYRRVTSISDFYSEREWRDHPMFVEAHARDPVHLHEIQLCLPDGPGRTARLLCFRGPGTDFGERERFLLTLLRPHITEAYRAAQRRTGIARLTPRQVEILELVREGCTNRQIGRWLHMSEATVRTHLTNIFSRLEVTSRTAAVARGLPDSFTADTG